MDKKTYWISGTMFIVAGGFLYTVERFISYYSWIGQMSAQTGSYPTYPVLPELFTNIFVPIFILTGIIFFVLGFRKEGSVK